MVLHCGEPLFAKVLSKCAFFVHTPLSTTPPLQCYLSRADLMDNAIIGDLLNYEPPWRDELEKWKEKRRALLSSTCTEAVATPSALEPGQDIGRWYTIRQQVCAWEGEGGGKRRGRERESRGERRGEREKGGERERERERER